MANRTDICPSRDDAQGHILDTDTGCCALCGKPYAEPARDDAYDRASARARRSDFAETNGKDWT